ncbi:MAG: DUF922 domain-containing protein [Chitinophagaceae bacterium]
MKIRYLHFFICLMLFSSSLFAQSDKEELIKWDDNKRLNWADYKGKPDDSSDAAASTSTYLVIDYSIWQNTMTYKIQSMFSKTRSWGLHKTDYILSHEQGHFDIAEVFARKLHKKMSEYKFNKRTYQKSLGNIYDEVVEEKTEMQNDYDRETRHSINKVKQAQWLRKIKKLLEEYEDYADY